MPTPIHDDRGGDAAKRSGASAEAVAEGTATARKSEQPAIHAQPSIGRNTVFALLAQLATGAFTTVLTLYLVRALGPDSFGVFSLALGVGAIAGLAADFGIVQSTSRFLAEHRDDDARIVSLLRDGLRLRLATAAIVPGALFLLAGPISAAYNQPALTWPLRGIAVSLFANSFFNFYTGVSIALGRLAVNLRLIFFESLAETIATIAFVAAGAGATGAAFGRAAGYFVGALIAAVVVVGLFGRASIRLFERGDGRIREIARYATPVFITYGAYTLYAQADVLIIGALLSTSAVGLFSAPFRLSVPLRYPGQALANSVAPRQAEKVRSRTTVGAFQTSLRWLIVYQAMFLAPLVVWAEPIVRLLFGPQFRDSTNVLRVLAFYMFLDGPSVLISTTVNYLGRAARRIPIVLVALFVNVAVDVALIPAIGVVGAAIGTGVAYGLYVPAHLWICHRRLRLDLRGLARTLFRALAAAVSMGAVLFAFGTHSLSIEQFLVGGTAGLAVFGLVLALTGEVRRAELSLARGFASRSLARIAAAAPSRR